MLNDSSPILLETTQEAREYLKKRDKRLGRFMDLAGEIRRATRPDPFQGLAHAIIGQQISGKAHDSIWKRFVEMIHPLTPGNVCICPQDTLKSCGISMRKAGYIQGIAREFACGSLNNQQLSAMADDELLKKLSSLRGVGPWTAEMLLIFTFRRPNVISFGDYAILRGMRMLYGHKEITREIFEKHRARYEPYATVASLYLWELAGGSYPHYTDLAVPKKRS